ncbi:recombinase family protein [Anaerotruncus rubiinfantis]|uniref:recombinase family protein n=4 Tax=Anaerotruncus rubiinfantis TaxID=1720200 RepID=UPI0034A1F048
MAQTSTAIYCRLSQDDRQVGESGSIQTQKTLLAQYCSDHHFSVYDTYCDDGWSGTNFERPQFQRMMEDIEAGKINIVVVKDLSRFGREYAQMGLYIEHYFEQKGVRFIAVGENIDTMNGTDNLVFPFTNVVNSFYARQASTKTKAAHRARAKAGMYLGGHAPYGYIKDVNDRHKLVVDPVAAEIVRQIFGLFAEGVGYVRMTKILRERQILNPQAYFNQNNPDYHKSDYWRQPFDWHATSVRSILNNPVYLGKVVFERSKTKGFFDKSIVAVPEQDWIVVDDAHEPLVTQEVWDTVHQLMKARRRENTGGEVQMFAGLVKCAGCGSSLNVSYSKQKRQYKNFSCWVYKNYGKERCTSHSIGWVTMQQLVLEDIRRNARAAQLAKQQYMDMLVTAKCEQQRRKTEKNRKELKSVRKRMAELEKILNKLYEDLALERITEGRYQAMAPRYEAEQDELRAKETALSQAVEQAEDTYSRIEEFVPLITKYTDITELNTYILNELIERIVVHEKTVDEDGGKSQRVDIYYKFVGYITG